MLTGSERSGNNFPPVRLIKSSSLTKLIPVDKIDELISIFEHEPHESSSYIKINRKKMEEFVHDAAEETHVFQITINQEIFKINEI
jgi:hypothetical protein